MSWVSKIKKAPKKAAKATGDFFNQDRDAANKAAKKQQKLYKSALEENAFSDARYADAQRSIMDSLITGTSPTVSEGEVNTRMEAVTPTINSQFNNNVWSTSRGKALSNATQNAQDSLVAEKKASQMSALDMLREESANRANIKVGQAAAVTPKATTLGSAKNAVNTASNVANAGANVASIS